MEFILKLFRILEAAAMFCIVLGMAFLFFKMILEPLGPVLTVVFVLVGTAASFSNRWAATLCVTGLVLYIASWVAIPKGPFATMTCYVGILIWFVGVFRPFKFPEKKPTSPMAG